MKIKAKNKDCRLIVKVKLQYGETLDRQEADKLNRIGSRGFLKIQRCNDSLVEYTGPVGICLADRLKKPMAKNEFFYIIAHFPLILRSMQIHNLHPDKLVLDVHSIFINEATREMQFLYLPIVKANKNDDLQSFIEKIVYSVIPIHEEDQDYAARFLAFLRGLSDLRPETIEQYIYRESPMVANSFQRGIGRMSGYMTNKPKHYYEHYAQPQHGADDDQPTSLLDSGLNNSDIDFNEPTGIITQGALDYEIQDTSCNEVYAERTESPQISQLVFDPFGETGLLEENCNAESVAGTYGILNTSVGQEETTLLYENESEATTLLDQPEVHAPHFPSLQRVSTGELVSINKPVFRIGKERSYVDYFVSNNSAISRSHADIITRGQKYFVVDLNSSNRTYINEYAIPVQCETEIHSGDRLRLANEDFVFLI